MKTFILITLLSLSSWANSPRFLSSITTPHRPFLEQWYSSFLQKTGLTTNIQDTTFFRHSLYSPSGFSMKNVVRREGKTLEDLITLHHFKTTSNGRLVMSQASFLNFTSTIPLRQNNRTIINLVSTRDTITELTLSVERGNLISFSLKPVTFNDEPFKITSWISLPLGHEITYAQLVEGKGKGYSHLQLLIFSRDPVSDELYAHVYLVYVNKRFSNPRDFVVDNKLLNSVKLPSDFPLLEVFNTRFPSLVKAE